MKLLKQNTTAMVMLGPIMKSSDAKTPSTALSLTTAPAIRLSKNGSTFINRDSSGAVTARHGGYYTVPLSSSDVNTLGPLKVIVQHSTSYEATWDDYMVQSTDANSAFCENIPKSLGEKTLTYQAMMRIGFAALAGLSTGAGSTTLKFVGATTGVIRIQAECGSSGNRKQITLKSTS